MTFKKCAFCKKLVEVKAGEYVDVYDQAKNMTSYHKDCYKIVIRNDLLEGEGF